MNKAEATPLKQRLDFATQIARQAGEQTLTLFRQRNLSVEEKSDGSPVTAADRNAEQLLRARITEAFPEDGILGEEFGVTEGKNEYRWVLDPIDGTKSFVSGVPLYTTLVAVLEGQQAQIGVICAPAAGEMVYAARGSGCWHLIDGGEPQAARVSTVEQLKDAVFLTTSVKQFSTDRQKDARPAFDQLQEACRVTRTWGDAYGYMLVATGRAEIMIDPELNLWDAAALQPVIEEAGGRFFDWHGQTTVHSSEAVATNRHLAESVLEILQDY